MSDEKVLKSIEVPDFKDDPTKSGSTIVKVTQYKDYNPRISLTRKMTDKNTGGEKEIPFVSISPYAVDRVCEVMKRFSEVILEKMSQKKEQEKQSQVDDLPNF